MSDRSHKSSTYRKKRTTFDELSFQVEHFPNQLNEQLKYYSDGFIEEHFNRQRDLEES